MHFPFKGLRQAAGLPGPLVFFLSFGIYLATVAPCVTFWDSGELILGAYSLGLPHPPAYPVFCLTGKIFSFLPFGNVAYRLNIFSSFFGAATAYIVYKLIAKMGEGVAGFDFVAASLALCFALYKSFWSVSVITEVYTLNSFLLAAAFYCLVVYESDGDWRHIYLSVFLLGIALANHQSVVFSLPVFLAYCLIANNNYKNPVAILVMLALFLLAYSVNMYLPLRASTGPLINIGGATDIEDFGWVIKWPAYVDMLEPLGAKALGLLKGENIPAVAGLLFCAAFAYIFRRRRLLLLAVFAALANFAGIELLTAGAEGIKKWGLQSKFYIPAALFATVFASGLLVELLRFKPVKHGASTLAVSFLVAFPLLASFEFSHNYKENDNSRNFYAYDFSHNTLKSSGQDGAVFALGDNGIFPVWYDQGVEKYRDDVLFIHTELLTYQWYMNREIRLLNKKYGIDFIPPEPLNEMAKNVQALRPLIEKHAPVSFDYSAAFNLSLSFDQLRTQGLLHLSPAWSGKRIGSVWDTYVIRGVSDGSTNKAFAAEGILTIYAWESMLWSQQAYSEGRPAEAVQAYNISKDFGPTNPNFDHWILKVKKEAGIP